MATSQAQISQLRRRISARGRSILGERNRGYLRRAAIRLGMRPRVNSAAANSVAFEGGRRAAVVISADLELAWAWRYARNVRDPLEFAEQRARQGRRNVGAILDLCDRYDLPITWATVGHLFLDSCHRASARKHPDLQRVPYFQNALWTYQTGDWFDHDPACDGPGESAWSAWYGPDLIDSILGRRVAHEIGCHTFSHVVFTEEQCPPVVALSELRYCQEAARRFGLSLHSFVFPGNLPGNRGCLRMAGFTAYRHRSEFELDVPRRDIFGLWQIPEGISLEKPFTSWSPAQQIDIIKRYIDVATERGLLCGLWFHPETDPRNVEAVFPDMFAYLASLRSDVWITSMGDLATWLDGQCLPNEQFAQEVRM